MNAIAGGLILLAGCAWYFVIRTGRAECWNYIAVWAAANRDADLCRRKRIKQYLSSGFGEN